MYRRLFGAGVATLAGFFITFASSGLGQPPGGFGQPGKGGFGKGPPGGQQRKILKDFDKNKDGWLNAEERVAARESLKNAGGNSKGGFKGGFGKGGEPGRPGPKITPAEVKTFPEAKLYEATVLRTIFIDFEEKDWEQELQDFHGTDVDVAATMTVDGKQYKNVGVHFRGMSSYMGVGMGSKRSLNVSMDMADSKQRLLGYKSLNLLNCHEDASQLSTVLYSHIARQYIPAPKANVVKVVINGESWGLYTNVQQFDKVFLQENYKTTKGTRWKVRGSPGGRGGFEYFGDDPESYKRIFEMKSDEDPKAWKALIQLCKVLNQTPADKLQAALEPIMDVDSLLWFLALDVALINSDGYWTRASDYTIFLDEKGKFHIIPHDMNESFHGAGGGPGGGMFRFGRPGEILPAPLQDGLRLTPEQRKSLEQLQKESDEKLNKLLTPEQRETLKQMQQGPPGFPGGGFPGGPGVFPPPPVGFPPPPGGFPAPPPPGGDAPPPPAPGGFPGFAQPPMGFGGQPGGAGGMGPRGGGGVELDPLVGLNDVSKPLRSKILAVPAFRTKYLANVKTIAEKDLDWKTLGPIVSQYRSLMEKEVEADTRKLESAEAFKRATADEAAAGGGRGMPLRAFADQRRKYLMNYTEPKKQ